jgi:phytoene/squalene synthetase
VGRLVLRIAGYDEARLDAWSDAICSALQLANFWQDIARDLRNLDRVYIPRTSMERFGVSEADLRTDQANQNVRKLIRFEVDRTEELFAKGDALLPLLDASTRRHVALFGMGGRAVLDAIRRQDYDTLRRRPVLSAWQKGRLIARVAANHVLGIASSSPSRRVAP